MPVLTHDFRMVGPGLVEVLDPPEAYRMSRADVLEAIQNVTARLEASPNLPGMRDRLNRYERILQALCAEEER